MTIDAILLDANVLIALSVVDHEHHERARTWLGQTRRFASTPSTQGSLARFMVRVASTSHAIDALAVLHENPRHEFWPDDEPYGSHVLHGVVGYRQVTDAYLAAMAQARGTTIATFDRGFAQLRAGVAELIA